MAATRTHTGMLLRHCSHYLDYFPSRVLTWKVISVVLVECSEYRAGKTGMLSLTFRFRSIKTSAPLNLVVFMAHLLLFQVMLPIC